MTSEKSATRTVVLSAIEAVADEPFEMPADATVIQIVARSSADDAYVGGVRRSRMFVWIERPAKAEE